MKLIFDTSQLHEQSSLEVKEFDYVCSDHHFGDGRLHIPY